MKPFDNKLESPFIMNPSRFASGGWDFDDDFTSYANDAAFAVVYPTDDSGEMLGRAATDDILVGFNGSASVNNNRIYTDLMGATIDDTAWILRQPTTIATYTAATSPYSITLYTGISSTTATQGSAQDFIGWCALGKSDAQLQYAVGINNTSLQLPPDISTMVQAFARAPAAEVINQEIIRTSSTQMTCELFSDAWVSSREKETFTISSSIINLRYWKCAGYDNAANGQITLTLQANLQFADGVTEAP